MSKQPKSQALTLYDTTLRDGSQGEEVSFTVQDKLLITERLDALGIHYIEAGWPGSNPRDLEYFQKARKLKLKQAKIAAFGATAHPQRKVSEDPNLKALIEAGTPVVTIFGKSWDLHVKSALRVSLAQNLDLIHDSIVFLKKRVPELAYDAEHFFDGWRANPDYALKTLQAAASAGADWIVLCDTNGGTLPFELEKIFLELKPKFAQPFGVHCHNDSELGVANSLAAVRGGALQIHGTINGIGERCGNANLVSVLANLQLKMGYKVVKPEQLARLTELSNLVDELANLAPNHRQPFVGQSAFAHKGGIHVSAVNKNPKTYEHIPPEQIGNRRRVLLSDLSGASNVLAKAQEFGIALDAKSPVVKQLVQELKALENEGFQFEGAEASFELRMRRALGQAMDFFRLIAFRSFSAQPGPGQSMLSEATVQIEVEGVAEHTVALGHGPVHALDQALRKALGRFFPELKQMQLLDYKVRVLHGSRGTAAKVRVLIESTDGQRTWATVGVSENVIEASWMALEDAVRYFLLQEKLRPKKK